MFKTRFLCLVLAALCLIGVAVPALAAQVDCDATYCFTSEDFALEEPLVGICVTGLPASDAGTVLLGSRVVRCGDILTAQQVEQMTFSPLRTETDREATVTFLPIYEHRVAQTAAMTISIRGKEDKAPVARDMTLETYKNLPNEGKLKVSDPEEEALTFSLVRKPRRGEVTLNEDGTFVYTPKKNKVGVDSFTFTAADPAGNVSNEATVTIQILKPADARQYTDTLGWDCRFAAEWLRNTGLFEGERVNGAECFHPEASVNRGQFMAMLVKALDIPAQETALEQVPGDIPNWLKPYYAAALRCGLLAQLPLSESGSFEADQPISGAEAAVMLQNALALEPGENYETGADVPQWATASVAAMAGNGIQLEAGEYLNRGQVAQVLYDAVKLAETAPGSTLLRMQQ